MINRFFVGLITLYQKTLSQVSPSSCRFYPSCSEYMKQAIIEHNLMKGIYLGLKRIIRCHPFSKGGIDYLGVQKK
jgi:uncharacterized protein